MNKVQLITSGDNQTVILPKDFHLQGTEVYVKKIGNAIVLISQENPWQTLLDSLNLFSEDFMSNRTQPALEIRQEL